MRFVPRAPAVTVPAPGRPLWRGARRGQRDAPLPQLGAPLQRVLHGFAACWHAGWLTSCLICLAMGCGAGGRPAGAGASNAPVPAPGSSRPADGSARSGLFRSFAGAPEIARRSLAFPAPQRAQAAAAGLLFLEPAPDRQRGLELVKRYFEAVIRESVSELTGLLEADAPLRSKDQSSTQGAIQAWRHRFRALDYTGLALYELYRPHAIECYTAADLQLLDPAREFALVPRADELLLSLELAGFAARRAQPGSSPGQPLFGRRLSFIVHDTPRGTLIRELAEDFQLR